MRSGSGRSVDASGSGVFGSVAQSKRELAAEIASVLAFSAIRNNDRVGLLLFTDRIEAFVPPRKGREHGLRVGLISNGQRDLDEFTAHHALDVDVERARADVYAVVNTVTALTADTFAPFPGEPTTLTGGVVS